MVAGSVVSFSFGLGGQNLPVSNQEALAQLAENRIPFLVREWFYLFVAVIAVGEGLGLYFLLKDSPWALWALIAWILGLAIGILEDAAVIALVDKVATTYPSASDPLRDSILFTTGIAFETIKLQQFVSLLLCCSVGYSLFSIVGYRLRRLPLWLCLVGILGGITTGCFGFCNVLGFDQGAQICENGFALLAIWDITVGIMLLSLANKRSQPIGNEPSSAIIG